MAKLGVNIDHIATLRQARRGAEPDPVFAAAQAQLAGADIITVHLREDRRHIQDRDVRLLRQTIAVPLNLEMAASEEIIAIGLEIKPEMVTLVPENRAEVTTEGGLDVAGQLSRMRDVVARFQSAGIAVSAFIDADERQIAAARDAGFTICEIHTGPYALATKTAARELEKVGIAGHAIQQMGMQFNAGHGLNYHNTPPIAALPGVTELHIGHSIISRAVFTGIAIAVRDMKQLCLPGAR